MYSNGGDSHHDELQREHMRTHEAMWKNFESVLRHCRRVGATVFIEWPRSCDYWKHERIQRVLLKN
eukprot:8404745-Lingulodinium_polyedra.AAC.1